MFIVRRHIWICSHYITYIFSSIVGKQDTRALPETVEWQRREGTAVDTALPLSATASFSINTKRGHAKLRGSSYNKNMLCHELHLAVWWMMFPARRWPMRTRNICMLRFGGVERILRCFAEKRSAVTMYTTRLIRGYIWKDVWNSEGSVILNLRQL